MPIDSTEHEALEDVQAIARNLKCDIPYPVSMSTLSLRSDDALAKFHDIEARHGVEVYHLRDRAPDSHYAERVLINPSACITPRNVFSETLPDFLKSLEAKMGISLDVDVHRGLSSWEDTQNARNTIGLNPARDLETNMRGKATFEADPRNITKKITIPSSAFF
jgi:hypothetical protein